MLKNKVITKGNKFDIDTNKMMEAGAHLGHQISKLHPKMKDYIFGVRNTIHIIDLEKTAVQLEKALEFIEELTKKGGILLLIGTKIPLRNLVKETADDCGIPYVNERWLGGTFTNFKIILERIKYFRGLEIEKKDGKLEKYTKKERVQFDKELKNLEVKFGGIENLEKIPEAIFVCDVKNDILAIKEARAKGVEVIAIVDTNVDPNLVDYPICANDGAVSSVQYILEKVKEAILSAKLKAKSEKLKTKN
jgi:small subunit ribosomal protein S2